jgi:hypothetical protein
MTPIVRLANGGDLYETLFVSLERTPVVLADVRRALPQLKKELRKKWPVEYVEIENRIPRRKNPYSPTEIVTGACIGLVVTFSVAIAKAAGTTIGKTLGDEISAHVRRWIRGLGNQKPSMRKKK